MSNDVENASNGNGSAGTPTPAASNPAATTSAIPEEWLKAIENHLSPIIENRVKSVKDKRFASQMGEMSDFRQQLSRLEELMKQGMPQQDALWRMEIEDRISKQTAPAEPAGTQKMQAPATSWQDLLDVMDLRADDPQVAEVLRANAEPALPLAALAKARKTPPNPAQQIVATQGRQLSGGDDLEQVTAQLEAAMQSPTANAKIIRELAAKQQELLKRT